MFVGFNAALTRGEIVKVDLYNLKVYLKDILIRHITVVLIPLVGSFKDEMVTRHYIISVVVTFVLQIGNRK